MAAENLKNDIADRVSAPCGHFRMIQTAKRRKSAVWRMALIAAAVFTIFLAVSVLFTAHDFPYAVQPAKADAVILFMGSGPETIARKKEAEHLVKARYAQVLIIPALQQVFTSDHIPPGILVVPEATESGAFNVYPGFYERTHLETLVAKKLMDARGLKSAIMVSSPYHMQRIKLISDKVFGERANGISYVPTRYQSAPANLRQKTFLFLKSAVLEPFKICWFRIYSLFL